MDTNTLKTEADIEAGLSDLTAPDFDSPDPELASSSEIIAGSTQPVTELNGLDWETLEIIADCSSRAIPVILKAATLLRHAPKLKMASAQLAATMKITETTLIAATTALPQLFEFTSKGTILRLRAEKPDPWDLDAKAYAKIQKAEDNRAKRRERDQIRLAKDDEDTPFNAIRAKLEDLGLIRDDARKFAGFLVRTYGESATASAVDKTLDKKPSEPKAYIAALLKKSLAEVSTRPASGGTSKNVRTVYANQRPDLNGTTKFVGWDHVETNGTRLKIWRQKTGQIKKVPPSPGEPIPSFDEDPGIRVID